ncbi:MAG: biotin--[acetyl-CoA-carboxylase] ligase [Tannerella sp.]|jgi:BirA family biotin operon repressor/biotin-[acetyl-CoA-carboxylase] ligase|nr:biotin--[acetyl-CoA-carboxylase] ligase [Tannerella sp.]
MPQLIHLHETASTNRYLQKWADTGEPESESVVITDFQTAGRGQPGNQWESESGKNLTFSTLLYPVHFTAQQPFLITELAALSVKYTLDHYVPDITIKWPNDIYWKDKKICGILIENEITGNFITRSIIGIGMNLNQQTFHSGAPNPVSLTQITGRSCDRMEALDRWRSIFHPLYQQLESGETEQFHQNYMSALYRREGFHAYQDAEGRFEARIHHIELSGHLTLERRNGALSRYAFKEVQFF